jgi:hypothetical protein
MGQYGKDFEIYILINALKHSNVRVTMFLDYRFLRRIVEQGIGLRKTVIC